jgi:hypothetical protein
MSGNRRQNIVVFSPRVSTMNGNMNRILSFFNEERKEYCNCVSWETLFAETNNKKKALLPMLIKKIPTFDFAIILGESVDKIIKNATLEPDSNEKRVQYISMRDNVLFECGLCVMALGTKRVILLKEKDLTLPADLKLHPELSELGLIAIKQIDYCNKPNNLNDQLELVYQYIEHEKTHLSPVVIGASISTADGYFTNFVLRFWENIGRGFEELVDEDITIKRSFPTNISNIIMEIRIPSKVDDDIASKIRNYYKINNYKRGLIRTGQIRGVDFYYKEDGGKFTVCDIPSTVSASRSTVNDILSIEADEKEADEGAHERFITKELDTFSFTLNHLMKDTPIHNKLSTVGFYQTDGGIVDGKKVKVVDEQKITNIKQIIRNNVEIKDITL